MTSPVLQTSGFPIFTIIWLEKMVTMKTVYGCIKVLRVFAHLLTGMWRIWSTTVYLMTGQSWKCREEFHGFVIFQYIVHEKFPFKCLSSFRIVLLSALTIDKLFYHIIHVSLGLVLIISYQTFSHKQFETGLFFAPYLIQISTLKLVFAPFSCLLHVIGLCNWMHFQI